MAADNRLLHGVCNISPSHLHPRMLGQLAVALRGSDIISEEAVALLGAVCSKKRFN